MDFIEIHEDRMAELWALQLKYKAEIGENEPTNEDLESLKKAIITGKILFYGCELDGELIACCSITETYSTFTYSIGGVFEDFYILPEFRHRGIARKLVRFAVSKSGVKSLTVGCADCDVAMYGSLGFSIPLGNLLAFQE